MDRKAPPPWLALRRLVNGYQVTQAIHVAAVLGVADLLADGTRTSDELAVATGTNPDALYRLLRALASVGVLREEDGRRFALTELGACLRTDAPDSVAGWAAFVGTPYHWQAWGGLEHSVRTGENAFRHVHGTDSWTFRAQHPELSASFDRAMTDLSRQVAATVVAAFDFDRFETVVDVGGGNGAFLAAILAKHPRMRGVLFDQPHVVTGAPSILAAAGVADRCEIVGGSFFDAVPEAGDAYVLKAILHDWEDEDCLRILGTCRRAMTEGSALLVVERELGPPNANPDDKFSDLNMLVAPGGRERTPEEYAALFAAAGFRFVGVTASDVGTAVFEGTAA
ncbi:MAG: methyltransferase [Thermomicrobiales bacterium]